MRKFVSYDIKNAVSLKGKLLRYASRFSRCCVLDSNEWQGSNNEMIVAFDSIHEIIPEKNSFYALKKFTAQEKDWLFGFFSYDLKNELENISSKNFDGIGFPSMHFFQPKYVCIIHENTIDVGFLPGHSSEKDAGALFAEINSAPLHTSACIQLQKLDCRVSKTEYISNVNKIKQHIQKGDIYEMNYCIEFFSENAAIAPVDIFIALNKRSETPFSAYYRFDDKYLMCASPERFMKKAGKKIISQPIKGTAKRGSNEAEDILMKAKLLNSIKDKSENVMIVDLVRNDLSKTCSNVSVEELFGIYSFRQWHQMISTVSGEMKKDVDAIDIIKNSFPMGSMTGAPKLRAMELIEKYEKTKRGLYSGATGYFSPASAPEADMDFDFNVVIRSVLFNSSSHYLSFQAGSAITADSVPEDEYNECLLKAKGMFEALGATASFFTKQTHFQNA